MAAMASFMAFAGACRPPLLRFQSLRPSPPRRFSFVFLSPRPPGSVHLLQLQRRSFSSSSSCRQQRPADQERHVVSGSGTDSAPCGGGVEEPQGKEAAGAHEKCAAPAAAKLQAAARRQRQPAPKARPAAPRGGRGGGRGGGGGGRPTPPGNPREGRGKGGGVIHAVTPPTTTSKPKPEPAEPEPEPPGDPREGGGGNGGVVNASPSTGASSSSSSSSSS